MGLLEGRSRSLQALRHGMFGVAVGFLFILMSVGLLEGQSQRWERLLLVPMAYGALAAVLGAAKYGMSTAQLIPTIFRASTKTRQALRYGVGTALLMIPLGLLTELVFGTLGTRWFHAVMNALAFSLVMAITGALRYRPSTAS
jgi:hypothetical protein